MPTRVLMPKLGLSMKTGTIGAWKVNHGDAVADGQTLFVVETEKVSMEIEAGASGILNQVEAAGATVPPGSLIGYILADGESAPVAEASSKAPQVASTNEGAPVTPAVPPPSVGTPARRVNSTPVARKVAAQLGVDIATVSGTGPGGRIVKEDVEAAASASVDSPTESTSLARPSEASIRHPMSQMRRAIARHMSDSLRESAQFSMGTEVDVTDLFSLRRRMTTGEGVHGPVPTVTDVLLYAVTRALRRHPGINAALDGDDIVVHSDVHLGLAVALTEGLVVPVLRFADRLSLVELMTARQSVVDSARSGSLTGDDMSGSTFTVTSLGQNSVTWFTPILNPPEAAILGVGRAIERVAWQDGAAVPRRLLPLSLTVDHRVIDGAPAAAFLDDLAHSLREPLRLLT